MSSHLSLPADSAWRSTNGGLLYRGVGVSSPFLAPCVEAMIEARDTVYVKTGKTWSAVSCKPRFDSETVLVLSFRCPRGAIHNWAYELSTISLNPLVASMLVSECNTETPKELSPPSDIGQLLTTIPALNARVTSPCENSSKKRFTCLGFCGHHPRAIWAVVIHLNDTHHWEREKIADWLETCEVDISIHLADRKVVQP